VKRAEFRRVYDEGSRLSATTFLAFCWNSRSPSGPRIGFTTTKALGKAVKRNRIRRRVREQVRVRLPEFPPEWWIVINPKRAALNCPAELIALDVQRLLDRCARWS
jgi:ribonuclease P protein component